MTISEKILSSLEGRQNQRFGATEVVDMVVVRFPETPRWSVMPADYCYNKTNKGNNFGFPFPLFEFENDMYKYLGPNFSYTGMAYWKGILIGEWVYGKYRLLRNLDDLEDL